METGDVPSPALTEVLDGFTRDGPGAGAAAAVVASLAAAAVGKAAQTSRGSVGRDLASERTIYRLLAAKARYASGATRAHARPASMASLREPSEPRGVPRVP